MPTGTGTTTKRKSLAGQKAALSRSRSSDDPEYRAVSEELAYEGLAEHAAKVVAAWGEPSEERLQKVAAILRAGGGA